MMKNNTDIEKEFRTQVALGTAEPEKYLTETFILACADPSSLTALVSLWSRARLPKEQLFKIADTLIVHPCIQEKDRARIVKERNALVEVHEMVRKAFGTIRKEYERIRDKHGKYISNLFEDLF